MRDTVPRHVIPAVLVTYACLLPRELQVDLAGAALFPYRLLLLALSPWILQQLLRNPVKFTVVDALAIFTSAWFIVALTVSTSLEVAIFSGSAAGLDFGLAYAVGRVTFRTASDFRRYFALILPGLAAIGLLLAIESISHRNLLRPLLARLLGQPQPELYIGMRMGLLRASGPFPHPILGGLFMSSTLALAWFGARTVRQRWIGVAVATTMIFTISSTALVNFVISAGLIAAIIVQRMVRLPVVSYIFYAIGALLLAIELTSKSGVLTWLIRNFTLDAGSGYYRILIWRYAGAEAKAHPFFGIGTADWDRLPWMHTDSIDAHWLALTMRYGFPMGIAYFLVMAGAIVALLRGSAKSPRSGRDVATGIAVALGTIMFAGFSVFLWEGFSAWMIMLSGAGVAIGMSAARERGQATFPPPPVRNPNRQVRPIAGR